ncbi:hypothetical protein KKE78_01250 [Patescibacteria group bacterium]|nr:hypothetical protein [Patescibacteria group bacterium]
MKNVTVLTVVLLLIGLGAGFFGGMQYQKNQRPSFGSANETFVNQQGRRSVTGQNNNRPVTGEIISADDKSITVKIVDGSSKIVLISDSTQIQKSDPGAKSDLKIGVKVAVFGSVNSDGIVSASNIQLNPQTQTREGFGTPSASPK